MGLGWARIGGIAGGFCAAFLAYVALGGAIGMVIAGPYNVDQNCWPHNTLFGIVRTECADPLADAAWHATIETARYFVVIPTLALAQLVEVVRTGSTYWLHDALEWGLKAAPILVMSVIGFVDVRRRNRALAWVLLVLLVGQIAVGVAPHVMGDVVEPM